MGFITGQPDTGDRVWPICPAPTCSSMGLTEPFDNVGFAVMLKRTEADFRVDKKACFWEFPGDLVVRTWRFHCQGPGSTPGRGPKIPQARSVAKKRKRSAFDVFLSHQSIPIFYKTALKWGCTRYLSVFTARSVRQ